MARGQRLRQRGQIWPRFISLHFFTLSVSNCASTFTARALTLAGSDLIPFLALDGQDRHGPVAPVAADRDGGVIGGSSLACACATWHLARPSLPRQPLGSATRFVCLLWRGPSGSRAGPYVVMGQSFVSGSEILPGLVFCARGRAPAQHYSDLKKKAQHL